MIPTKLYLYLLSDTQLYGFHSQNVCFCVYMCVCTCGGVCISQKQLQGTAKNNGLEGNQEF